MRYRTLIVSVLVLCSGLPARAECPPPLELQREEVGILTASGERRFQVELADSEEARTTGLMCRQNLAPDTGMLFVYPRTQVVRMWMQNTWIALDMLFIAADGRIVHSVSGIQPGSPGKISSRKPVRMVLELPAGTVARLGIHVGDQIRRPTKPSPPASG